MFKPCSMIAHLPELLHGEGHGEGWLRSRL